LEIFPADYGPVYPRGLFREEFFIGLDSAFLPAENSGIGGLDVPEEIQYFANRFHAPVGNLTIKCGELGGIALDNEHPAANGAHRSTNNFHEQPQGYNNAEIF
jgi:hypothetical protein